MPARHGGAARDVFAHDFHLDRQVKRSVWNEAQRSTRNNASTEVTILYTLLCRFSQSCHHADRKSRVFSIRWNNGKRADSVARVLALIRGRIRRFASQFLGRRDRDASFSHIGAHRIRRYFEVNLRGVLTIGEEHQWERPDGSPARVPMNESS